jgi:hypothetical protein
VRKNFVNHLIVIQIDENLTLDVMTLDLQGLMIEIDEKCPEVMNGDMILDLMVVEMRGCEMIR